MTNGGPVRWVVLDANAWMQEWMLQSVVGGKLVDVVARSGGKLLLPEIVEREITFGTARRAQESLTKVRAELSRVAALTHSDLVPSLPDANALTAAVASRLKDLAPLIEREEFTFPVARAALERIFSKVPPCGQDNEQFRDACIWECCVVRGMDEEVVFVSEDRAFYEGKKIENGLDHRLTEELQRRAASVRLYPTVSRLLDVLEPGVPDPDSEYIARLIVPDLLATLRDRASKSHFELGDINASSITLTFTRSPVVKLAKFQIEMSLSEAGANSGERIDPTLIVEGTAAFNIAERSVTQVRAENIALCWTDPSGLGVRTNHYFLHVGEVFSAGTAISFA